MGGASGRSPAGARPAARSRGRASEDAPDSGPPGGGRRRLFADRPFLVEVFIAANLAFLVLDVYVAHSTDVCCGAREAIPVVFSALAAVVLVANLVVSRPAGVGGRRYDEGGGRWLGLAGGAAAIGVGVTGLIFHLESNFFQAMTLRSLVYSAPFVAPLAFTGLGLLLLANRLVPTDSPDWGRSVLLLAWGGFIGNFVLSLMDHAQNGFFYPVEWIPVAVAALAVGFLLLPLLTRTSPGFLKAAMGVLALAAATGVVGFFLHVAPALTEQRGTLAGRIIYGAPIFAPLLFPNLALLAGLALWDLLDRDRVADGDD